MIDKLVAFVSNRFHAPVAFVEKLMKDNVGMLASVVSWALLTSLVPIASGIVAICGLFLQSPQAQQSVVDHLSRALQGAVSPSDLQNLVNLATQHTGLLGLIAFLGILWAGSSVGGAISTVFQPIFEAHGRSFVQQKLIDIGMIFVFALLLMIVLAGTTASTMLERIFSGFPVTGFSSFVIGTAISIGAAFLLFGSIYGVFPNISTESKVRTTWRGALLAAVLFQILSYIWPLYAKFAHFSKYGAVLAPIVVLGAWIYFFSLILILGAEVVAFGALEKGRAPEEETVSYSNVQ
jgi:YihY family inner membrane protein